MSYTPIADLVARLLDNGLDRDAVVAAVRAVERASPRRGRRIPADWQPSNEDFAFAGKCGMTDAQITTELDKFRNYWAAKTGQGATKLDWGRTWQNWILKGMNNATRNYRSASNARSEPRGADAIIAGLGRVAARFDQRRSAAASRNGAIPHGSDVVGRIMLAYPSAPS
jgi:hypothetical protein